MMQVHGGNTFQYGNVLDFSANINPLGMPESVKQAVLSSVNQWEGYPDPHCTELTKKLSEHEHIPEKNIVCGNGADDLIFRAVHALKPKKAVIPVPTFSEYGKALMEVGCEIYEHPLQAQNGFVPDDSILHHLDRETDMLILCSPNNPTGKLIPAELLKEIAQRCCENGIVLMCDECFIGFAENGNAHSLHPFLNEKCIILNAFTKLYAMAGLRLGYMICGDCGLADQIRNNGQYWCVSAPAQAAGCAALDETEYAAKTVEYVKTERAFLIQQLSALGITVYPSDVNYLLIRSETWLADRLLQHGILIRSCSDYSGLDGRFFRIAVRTHAENVKLIYALGRCLRGETDHDTGHDV